MENVKKKILGTVKEWFFFYFYDKFSYLKNRKK